MSKKKSSKKHTVRKTMFEGLPVVDAKDDIVLNVTKNDINLSRKKDPNGCAIAKAGSRELHVPVKVFLSRMYVKEDNKQWVRYLTPSNAAREIVSFDRGSSFEPGEFVFKAATGGQKLGVIHGKNHKETNKGKKRPNHHTANVRVSAHTGYSR